MYGPVTHRYHSFCILADKESYDFRASNFSIASITSSDTGAERKATKGLAKGDWRASNFGFASIMSSDAGTEREVTTGRVSKGIAHECDDSSYPTKRKAKCKTSETTTLEPHWIQELTCKDNIKNDPYLEVLLQAISHPRSSKSNRTNTTYGGRSINAFCHGRDRFQRRHQLGRRTKTSYGKGWSIDAFCHRRDRFQRRQSVWWEGEEEKAKKMNESASEEQYSGGRSIDAFCLRHDRFQRRCHPRKLPNCRIGFRIRIFSALGTNVVPFSVSQRSMFWRTNRKAL